MSFISQLIASKGTPGHHNDPIGMHSPITSTASTATTGAHHAPPSFSPGFGSAGFAGLGATGFGGLGGIGGASPAGGLGAATRLPMRANLGLPIGLQMPFSTSAPAFGTNNNNSSSSTSTTSTTSSSTAPKATAAPVIPNMRRPAPQSSNSSSSSSASTPAAPVSSTISSSSSSSSSSTTNATAVPPAVPTTTVPTTVPTTSAWNDAEKMQDFFLHIKDPAQFAHAENKLISIKDLVARNASPLERFETTPKNDFSTNQQSSADDTSSTASTSASTSASASPVPSVATVSSPATTAAAKRPESSTSHSALTDMLAARSGKTTTPVNVVKATDREVSNQDDNDRHATPSEDARGNMLAEMLARRGGGNSTSTGATQPAQQATSVETPTKSQPKLKSKAAAPAAGGDARGNMLAEMLARRGGDDATTQPAPFVETPTKKTSSVAGGDARGNMLAEMLAKRGGSGPSTPSKTESPAKSSEKLNPLAAMLAKRTAAVAPSTPTKPKTKSTESATNPLAAMLAKRTAPPSPSPSAGNPQESEAAQPQSSIEPAPVALRDDPTFAPYFKMLKIGHPAPVVKHRMQRDGVDPSILDLDPSQPKPDPKDKESDTQSSAADAEAERVFQVQLAEYNDKVGKYTQMLKVGLPRPVVEHKMRMEGVDPAWLDGPPVKKVAAPTAVPAAPTEAEIAAHREKYSKYFAMLRVGLPRGAVEHKMQMAGIDPKELDGPRATLVSVPADTKSNSPSTEGKTLKRTNSIRKKIHWEVKTPATHKRTGSRDSLWTFPLADDALMDDIQVSRESMEMLEKLFVKELAPPGAAKAKTGNKTKTGTGGTASDDAKKKPQMVVLIDMKKSQNIAITLARVKLAFPELKREILAMNPTVLSTAQLQSLMDMWPDHAEQQAIDSYKGDMSLLGTTEKFLVETRSVPRFKEKLACLVFKQEFPTRVHELRESIKLIIRGVNQVCESHALRQLFLYILRMGNLLNFGTEQVSTTAVGGFSLSSLVKLSQTKAFVGGITFLHYVVQSIERDVPHLARFYDQVSLTSKCAKVSLSVLLSEKKALDDGLAMLQREANVAVPSDVADAELATSILKHFATEVEHELEALDELLNEMDASKSYFLEYFEEEETSDELDVLFGHIANFTDEYKREHTKFLEMQRQQRLKELKAQAQAMRHSLSSHSRPPTGSTTATAGGTRQSRHSHHGHSHRERHASSSSSTASDDVSVSGSTHDTRRPHHPGLMERHHHGLVEFHPSGDSSASGGDLHTRTLRRTSSALPSLLSIKSSDSVGSATTPASPLAAPVGSASSSCA